jgi:hypothetical protein
MGPGVCSSQKQCPLSRSSLSIWFAPTRMSEKTQLLTSCIALWRFATKPSREQSDVSCNTTSYCSPLMCGGFPEPISVLLPPFPRGLRHSASSFVNCIALCLLPTTLGHTAESSRAGPGLLFCASRSRAQGARPRTLFETRPPYTSDCKIAVSDWSIQRTFRNIRMSVVCWFPWNYGATIPSTCQLQNVGIA